MSFRNSSKRRQAKRVARLRKQGRALNDFAEVSPEVAVKMLMRTFIYPQRALAKGEVRDVLAKAEQLTIPRGRRRLRAYRWAGEPDCPTVALLHDWEQESGYWHDYIRGLRDKCCTVIALDAPASGHSDGKRLSLRDYINAIHALRSRVGHIDCMVGHGMGGAALVQALAQMPAVQRPQRAVLMGVNADSKEIFQRRLEGFGIDEQVRLKFWKRLGRTRDIPLSNYDNVLAATRLADVQGLVVHDRADARYPMADAEAIAEAWPGAKLMDFEGFGHELQGLPVLTRLLPFVGAKAMLAARAA